MVTAAKNQISLDGALLHSLRVPLGYWEAKDEEDDLDKEIVKKFKTGYPRDNIIFEDTTYAVLIQNGAEAMRCRMDGPELLEKLLNCFSPMNGRKSQIPQGGRTIQNRFARCPRRITGHDRHGRGRQRRFL